MPKVKLRIYPEYLGAFLDENNINWKDLSNHELEQYDVEFNVKSCTDAFLLGIAYRRFAEKCERN